MGPGFLESVYQECLEREFALQEIPAVSQPDMPLHYKHHQLSKTFTPDFICLGKIILEIKSVQELNEVFRAQIINCLKATQMRPRILVNFNHHPKVEYERFVL